VSRGERLLRVTRDLWIATFLLLLVPACGGQPIAELTYVCGTVAPSAPAPGVCGAGDPNLPPEPTLPADVCETLVAEKTFPDENNLDTARIQAALTRCKSRGAVKLVSNGAYHAFVAGHLDVNSVILWVDAGTTLYASRNANLYQKTGSCGVPGINDSSACNDFITMSGTRPGIVGDGTIDGQAGEPLVGHDYSWWQLSGALRGINGSIGNPTLINTASNTSGVLIYRITLHDSPKFHVKLTSVPPDGSCSTPGEGYIVWGITILTPRHWINSQGLLMTPHFARNTDGVDPGTTDIATCGVIACNTISTGDDQIAIKGGHWVSDLIIAHNHFGTGHGMSIGSETYGTYIDPAGVKHRGVENVLVYDLTIDADSRPVGEDSSSADSNGIRVKSDPSRGGVVTNITFRDVCMRDQANAILVSTAYNPLFPGTMIPEFGSLNFENIRHVSCMELKLPVVTLEGFSARARAGPIKLDNVVIDNIGPPAVAAEFVDIRLGPGRTNFVPTGPGVVVANEMTENGPAKECTFPKLPVPKLPAGWLR
jgi:polygalacturonase